MSNSSRQDAPRIRLWPAILVALLHVAVAWGLGVFGNTNVVNGIALAGVPLASGVLLLVWWLFQRRVPLRDRLVGLVVLGAGSGMVMLSQRPLWHGAVLLAVALPYMTVGTVAVFVVTCRLRWPVRRWLLVAYILACAGTFCAMRIESLGGDLVPVRSWKWRPTAGQRSDALPEFAEGRVATLPGRAGPGDWADFRGPRRDGRLMGFSFDASFTPKELWRKDIGAGYASFTAVGEYLFTQEQRGDEELVTCYRADTGEPVWRNAVTERFEDSMGLGPRATPVFWEGRLYTQGGTGILQCLDAATGETIWKRDLKADAARDVPMYGFSSTPLVAAGMLVVFASGGEGECVIAYDCRTGEEAWRGGTLGGGYCSPMLADVQGVPQVVMGSSSGLEAFVPETGEVLWKHAWKSERYARSVQPVVHAGTHVLIAATTGTGTRSVRVEKAGEAWSTAAVWTNKRFRPYFNNGVLHEGHYYGYDDMRVACVDMATGEKLWSSSRYGGQLLLIAGMDLLLVLTEKGRVVFVPATPGGFREEGSFDALTGKTWNHPVIAHGRLFVRNSREAACFQLQTDGPRRD